MLRIFSPLKSLIVFLSVVAVIAQNESSKEEMSLIGKYKKLVFESGKETATIIWMHGLGDTPHGWADVAQSMRRTHPHIRWVLPEALEQPVTCNRGYESTSWFDLVEIPIKPTSKDNGEGQKQSIDYIHELINEETSKGISTERIILGGFSQGAALALASTLKFNNKQENQGRHLGGCVVFSGWPLVAQKFSENLVMSETKFLIGHGAMDQVVLKSNADDSIKLLKTEKEGQVSLKIYKHMEHSSCPEEIRDLSEFIKTVLPAAK